MHFSRLKISILILFIFFIASCNPGSDSPTPVSLEPTGTQSTTQEPTAVPMTQTSVPVAEPTTFPAVKSIFGLEIGDRKSLEQTNLAIETGALWIRKNALIWSDVEPIEGQRQWENAETLESQLKILGEQGLETILIVRSTPEWAQLEPGVFCGPVHPDKLQAFGQFIFDAVTRYSHPPYNIHYWELGNEPDIAIRDISPKSAYGCWGNKEDPYFGGGLYADMLKAVYPQIKAADPNAQVLVGGLLLDCNPNNPPLDQNGNPRSCLPSRYLEGILHHGGGDFFDGISFHAYDYYYPRNNTYGNTNWYSGQLADKSAGELVPATVAKAQYLRALLSQYGHPDKLLINTETALICGQNGKEEACQSDLFQTTKAHYLVHSTTIAYAEGLHANIWYSLFGWRASGLADSQTLTQFPVFLAYQFAVSQFAPAIFKQAHDLPGVFAYEFQTPDKTFWVVWSANGDPVPLDFPMPPQALYDTFGASLPISQQITVDAGPVYVEWLP